MWATSYFLGVRQTVDKWSPRHSYKKENIGGEKKQPTFTFILQRQASYRATDFYFFVFYNERERLSAQGKEEFAFSACYCEARDKLGEHQRRHPMLISILS